MKKKDLRLFFGAFAITLILVGTLCGFMAVKSTTTQYGFIQDTTLAKFHRQEGAVYSATLLGQAYTIDLSALNTIEHYRKEYAGMTTPRELRLLLIAKEYGKLLYRQLEDAYRNTFAYK